MTLLTIVLVLALFGRAPEQGAEGLRLSASLVANATDGRVVLDLRIVNMSNEGRRVIAPLVWPSDMLMISVIDSSGRPLTPMNYAVSDVGPVVYARQWSMSIPPSAFFGTTIQLTAPPGATQARFELTPRATYRLWVTLNAVDPATQRGFLLVSDTVLLRPQ